jgi:hypothetical protein
VVVADERLERIVALGRAIRARIDQAELDEAGQLAAERHRRLVALFADPGLDREDEGLAYWLQEIVREDRVLLQSLAELRERMEQEFDRARRAAQSARRYAETAHQGGAR